MIHRKLLPAVSVARIQRLPATLLLGVLLLASALPGRAAPNPLVLSRLSLSARADLGQAVFTYHITPENKSANVALQIFVHRDDIKGREQWDNITPMNKDGAPLIVNLFQGLDNTGTFTVPLSQGVYGAVRLLMFSAPDGKSPDFAQTLYDSAADPKSPALDLKLKITRGGKRVVAPVLVTPKNVESTLSSDGAYTVTIPASVRIPPGYTAEANGLWAMVKGSGGFAQEWVGLEQAQPGGDPEDPYQVIPVRFTLKDVKPGLWNVELGLFKHSFGDALQWVWPGLDFEVGGDSWVVKAPAERIPPRLRVRQNRFETLDGKPFDFYAGKPAARRAVGFVRGGNYGNAISWTLKPELNTPGYFVLLKGLGCRFLRFNFNPNRYADEPLYQHAVDQVVQNVWAAGVYPLLCPQDLPDGDTREQRVEKGLRVVQAMATKYRGKPVWLQLCNEPHAFGAWAEWKPVATRYVQAIRAIDPEAFVVVPFEDFSKDGRAAAKDPIKEVPVDLYDGHAYVAPNEVAARFGTPVQAGLPVLIGEYGGGAEFIADIHAALEKLPPGLMAAGPWAFTIQGQDSLPLVEDGSTAVLRLTPAGRVVARDYADWEAGKKTDTPPAAAAPAKGKTAKTSKASAKR